MIINKVRFQDYLVLYSYICTVKSYPNKQSDADHGN